MLNILPSPLIGVISSMILVIGIKYHYNDT
jgi:hypothetical protein